MSEDLGRYESAVGWEPKDPYKKARERVRKQQLREAQPFDAMLETRPASEWIKRGCNSMPPAELYGSLWREGELAVLIGDSGSGKSVLAVQIAESIARGRPALSALPAPTGRALGSKIRSPQSTPRNRKVLYLDFEHAERQFTERYSAPSPIPGKLPVRHRFSKNFFRTAINWHAVEPGKDLARAMQSAIYSEIEETGAKVVILDDITLAGENHMRSRGNLRTMRTLKMWSATQGLSILVLARVRSPRVGKGLGGHCRRSSIISHHFDLADSVFAINHSTFGPDYRYVKHLASRSTPIVPDADVLTYQMNPASSPPYEGGVAEGRGGSLLAPPLLVSSSPFLFLGPSQESDHLRDYEKEARDATHAQERELKRPRQRTSKDILVDGILDSSYGRYLKGE
ncbi:MAG: AAA family ATPase [Blastocatellia bacterium]